MTMGAVPSLMWLLLAIVLLSRDCQGFLHKDNNNYRRPLFRHQNHPLSRSARLRALNDENTPDGTAEEVLSKKKKNNNKKPENAKRMKTANSESTSEPFYLRPTMETSWRDDDDDERLTEGKDSRQSSKNQNINKMKEINWLDISWMPRLTLSGLPKGVVDDVLPNKNKNTMNVQSTTTTRRVQNTLSSLNIFNITDELDADKDTVLVSYVTGSVIAMALGASSPVTVATGIATGYAAANDAGVVGKASRKTGETVRFLGRCLDTTARFTSDVGTSVARAARLGLSTMQLGGGVDEQELLRTARRVSDYRQRSRNNLEDGTFRGYAEAARFDGNENNNLNGGETTVTSDEEASAQETMDQLRAQLADIGMQSILDGDDDEEAKKPAPMRFPKQFRKEAPGRLESTIPSQSFTGVKKEEISQKADTLSPQVNLDPKPSSGPNVRKRPSRRAEESDDGKAKAAPLPRPELEAEILDLQTRLGQAVVKSTAMSMQNPAKASAENAASSLEEDSTKESSPMTRSALAATTATALTRVSEPLADKKSSQERLKQVRANSAASRQDTTAVEENETMAVSSRNDLIDDQSRSQRNPAAPMLDSIVNTTASNLTSQTSSVAVNMTTAETGGVQNSTLMGQDTIEPAPALSNPDPEREDTMKRFTPTPAVPVSLTNSSKVSVDRLEQVRANIDAAKKNRAGGMKQGPLPLKAVTGGSTEETRLNRSASDYSAGSSQVFGPITTSCRALDRLEQTRINIEAARQNKGSLGGDKNASEPVSSSNIQGTTSQLQQTRANIAAVRMNQSYPLVGFSFSDSSSRAMSRLEQTRSNIADARKNLVDPGGNKQTPTMQPFDSRVSSFNADSNTDGLMQQVVNETQAPGSGTLAPPDDVVSVKKSLDDLLAKLAVVGVKNDPGDAMKATRTSILDKDDDSAVQQEENDLEETLLSPRMESPSERYYRIRSFVERESEKEKKRIANLRAAMDLKARYDRPNGDIPVNGASELSEEQFLMLRSYLAQENDKKKRRAERDRLKSARIVPSNAEDTESTKHLMVEAAQLKEFIDQLREAIAQQKEMKSNIAGSLKSGGFSRQASSQPNGKTGAEEPFDSVGDLQGEPPSTLLQPDEEIATPAETKISEETQQSSDLEALVEKMRALQDVLKGRSTGGASNDFSIAQSGDQSDEGSFFRSGDVEKLSRAITDAIERNTEINRQPINDVSVTLNVISSVTLNTSKEADAEVQRSGTEAMAASYVPPSPDVSSFPDVSPLPTTVSPTQQQYPKARLVPSQRSIDSNEWNAPYDAVQNFSPPPFSTEDDFSWADQGVPSVETKLEPTGSSKGDTLMALMTFETRSGRFDRAEDAWRNYLTLYPSAGTYLKFAEWAEFDASDIQLARTVYESMVDELTLKDVRQSWVLKQWAAFEQRQGDVARADEIASGNFQNPGRRLNVVRQGSSKQWQGLREALNLGDGTNNRDESGGNSVGDILASLPKPRR